MPGPEATIGSMHVCPMVTGYIPHVGGPVTGPVVPTVLIGGKPAATVGCMTAHGGSVTVGEPTVLIGTGGSGATAVMPLKKIPFPKIRIVDRVGAMMRGKSLQEAEAKQAALKKEAEEQEPQPKIISVEIIDEENGKQCRSRVF